MRKHLLNKDRREVGEEEEEREKEGQEEEHEEEIKK